MEETWYCMKCGKQLEDWICKSCGVSYTVHGTGVYPSLFIAGAESYPIDKDRYDPFHQLEDFDGF